MSTFSDHVSELRRRSMWVGLLFVAGSALAYSYNELLLQWVMMPLDGERLVYLTPGGGFSFIFQVSMYTGLLFAVPALIYHLHSFIKPALPLQAHRSAIKVVLAATALIVAGASYGYFIAIPAALRFLTTFAGDAVSPNLTADSYLGFFLAYVAGLALLSLLPLILLFVHWVKPLTPGGLMKSERWVILLAFVAAAIITPTPDAVNQTMIALPVIAIYQLGVIAVFVSVRRARKMQRASGVAQSRIAADMQQSRSLSDISSTHVSDSFATTTTSAAIVPKSGASLATTAHPSKRHPVAIALPRRTAPISVNARNRSGHVL